MEIKKLATVAVPVVVSALLAVNSIATVVPVLCKHFDIFPIQKM
jgi:hypothetical protein